MFQKAAKYFFMENNLEMAGLSYLEEGKCYLKLNKLPQALEAFKTALTTFEDINISSIRKGLTVIMEPWTVETGRPRLDPSSNQFRNKIID